MTQQATFNFVSRKSNTRLYYRRKTTGKGTTYTRNNQSCDKNEYDKALLFSRAN